MARKLIHASNVQSCNHYHYYYIAISNDPNWYILVKFNLEYIKHFSLQIFFEYYKNRVWFVARRWHYSERLNVAPWYICERCYIRHLNSETIINVYKPLLSTGFHEKHSSMNLVRSAEALFSFDSTWSIRSLLAQCTSVSNLMSYSSVRFLEAFFRN